MPWLSVYGSVRQAIQDLVAPEIQKLHGEIKSLEGKLTGKIEGLEGRIQGIEGKFDAKFEGLEAKLEGFRSEVNVKFDAVDKRLASVEETVKANTRKIDNFIEERIENYLKSIDQKWHESIDIHERLAVLEANSRRDNCVSGGSER